MLYFSEISGKQVFNKEGVLIGTLHDLLFLPIETPYITKVVIKGPNNQQVIAPVHLLKKYNGRGFILTDNFEAQEKKEDEASILKNVQDKQIIDLKGEAIIRANDVAIQEYPSYVIVGIDVGVLGVFRWIGAARFIAKLLGDFNIHYKSDFLPWSQVQPLEAARGKIILAQEKEKFKKLAPEDLAEYLEKTTTVNALKVLKLMDSKLSARVIADINIGFQGELFRKFSPEKSAKIISLMDPDEAVDILLTLSEKKQKEILALIEPRKKKPIMYLFKYAKTPIGELMTAEYLLVPADYTVKAALDKVRAETPDFSHLIYIYTTNKEGGLVGVVTMHDLVIQSQDTPLYKFMVQNIVLIRLTTPREIAIKKMLKYKLQALPVVDEEKHLVGVVPYYAIADDLLQTIVQNTT